MLILLLFSAFLTGSVHGHGYLKSPRSRNFIAYEDGLWYGGTATHPDKESCPHCLNRGGVSASCGKIGGRNYDYPKNALGNALQWSSQETFNEEAIIDVEVVLSAHHKGHFVFKACPISEKQIPDEECFNKYPLEFVSDELYSAPKDINHPARVYIAPPAMGIYDNSGVYGMLFHVKVKLPPGLSGEVLFQWKYYTANSCTYDGYDTYPFPATSWYTANLGMCAPDAPDDSVPERFWNCAEIFIDGPKDPTTSPISTPTKSPVVPVPTVITGTPTEQPQSSTDSPTKAPSVTTDKKVVAYYASWQYYDRNDLAKPENFDFNKVDRINFAFFQSDVAGNLYGTDEWGDPLVLFGPYNFNPGPGDTCINSWTGPNNAKTCNYHSNIEKGLIHLVHAAGAEIYPSIGGWTLSSNFPIIAASAATRLNFANQCVDLIKEYNFDGIDIDWEYPGYAPHGGTAQDKMNFNLLLDEVRARLDGLTATTGKPYGLTAALPCGPSNIDNIDVQHVANVLDEVLLMSYDLHGPWDLVTGINSPLYYQGFGDDRLSVDACVNLWKSNGAPSSKLSIGLAFYGRSFKQASALNQSHQGIDTNNWGEDDGLPQYFNIVKQIAAGNLKSYRHEASKTPYAYFDNGSGFVSYDNEQSICEKTGYVIENNLKGFLIWELSSDLMQDLSTPLLDSVNKKLANPNHVCDGSVNTPTPTRGPTTPIASPTTSPITPTTSPVTQPIGCDDPKFVFKMRKKTSSTNKNKKCSDIRKSKFQSWCKNSEVSKTCPDACGKCDKFKDSPFKFKLGNKFRNCKYVKRKKKCEQNGVAEACRATCEKHLDTPTAAPTKSPSANSITCPPNHTGLKAAEDCTKYYHCVSGVVTGPLLPCSDLTLFNEPLQICDWADNVVCS